MNVINKIDKYLNEKKDLSDVENEIRDHLSGKDRTTTKKLMSNLVKTDKKTFEKAWKNLVDDGYLIDAGGGKYKWEG
jgi:predicted HTH transcriptional regulator